MTAPLDSDSNASAPAYAASSLTLGFDNVTVRRDKQVVINNASGIIHGGRVTAIVSCSGTPGDSFLLGALAGRGECAGGAIMMNGLPMDAPAYLHHAALIDEEFTALEELTVRESIEYAASMRVAASAFTVQEIIETLMLEGAADAVVRTCSLYVRRRVSLGRELLLNPRVLCFDQLLEGLRTHEAQEFMRLLRRIAVPASAASSPNHSLPLTSPLPRLSPPRNPAVASAEALQAPPAAAAAAPAMEESASSSRHSVAVELQRGRERIVLVAMSQPRWAILKFVDDVILLEREKCVFCGPLTELFAAIRVDPASAVVENAISSLYRLASGSESSLSDTFAHSGNAERVQRSVMLFFHSCASGREMLAGRPYSSPGAHVRLFCMFKYDLLQVRHNLYLGGPIFLLLVVLVVVLAAVYNSQEGQSGMQNRIGIIFFLVSSTFLYSILALDSQRREYSRFLRHRAHGYYGVCTYLTYAVLYCVLERIFFLSVLTFAGFCVSNVGEKWNYYRLIMELVLIIGVMSICSHFVVFFFCTVIWTRRVAIFVLFAVYTLNLLLAGIILNLTTLPKAFQFISNVSLIRLAYESSILSQFLGRDFGCGQTNETMCYTGPEYAAFLGFKESRMWVNVGILAGISALLIMGCLCAMLWHRPPRDRC
ncbi:putative ABC transporter [Trypanosoma conorhini]|uniref:Putative ABC transporter n=1 Tax=Trypanosoma conorhini TaxID=83891 RepID=A0A422Q3F1_9TRYP|nr:putative ABC transporter [Trypanosoma conorhini]RNF24489.1 putative ABC transporter [Trypanosoma conorhini]